LLLLRLLLRDWLRSRWDDLAAKDARCRQMKRVSRIKSFAKKIGVSQRHIQRLIAAGEGPVLTELGKRIKGVADDDGDAWLARRRKLPPGWVDPTLTEDGAIGINEADATLGRTSPENAGARCLRTSVGGASQAHTIRSPSDPERHRVRAAKKKPAG
jgi:predicted DNA-binding transcriptional regulator AlpA